MASPAGRSRGAERLVALAGDVALLRPALLALALMLALFALRIWDLGIVQNDDAIWALHAWRGDWDVILRWARDQGRIWALVSGPILLFALKVKGSLAGDLAIVATFAAFFVAFHAAVAMYFGRALALLAAALSLAFWSMRWEGNVLTAYPAFTWLLGVAFVGSLFAARRHLANGGVVALAASLLLLLLALCMHEGVSVLFATLYPLAVTADARRLADRTPRRRTLLTGYAIVVALYFLAYFLWRQAFPSAYAGNSLAPFDPLRISRVAASFALSGSLPFDAVIPYVVRFVNPASGEASRVAYRLADYLRTAAALPAALTFGALAALVCWQALRGGGRLSADRRSTCAAIAIGALIAVVPILPVAMTVRYQQWHYEHGIRSYVHTGLSHFGVALVLGGGLLLAARASASPRLHRAFTPVVSALVGVLAAGGYAMNDAIAADMRSEANRWRVLDRTIELLEREGGARHAVVIAPRFASGSWFTVLPASYWSQWAKARHGVDLTFTTGPLPALDAGGRAYLVDYRETEHHARTIVVARLRPDAAIGAIVADRILVAPHGADPQALKEFVVYRDRRRGQNVIRLENIPALAGAREVRVIDHVVADPTSIQVQRDAPMPALPTACRAVLQEGDRAAFGTAPPMAHCVHTTALRDGWHAAERNGAWSKAPVATLRVRVAASAAGGDPTLRLVVKSYPGLGFYAAKARIRIRAADSVVADVEDRSDTPSSIEFVVPRRAIAADGSLDLAIEIDRVFNPKALGVAADTRDLGVHLQSLEVLRTDAAGGQAGSAVRRTNDDPRATAPSVAAR